MIICSKRRCSYHVSDGCTLHGAFDFKFENEHRGLTDQKFAKLHDAYEYLQVLIIDEVSLIGADMLYQIHLRLCEIKKNPKELFGGISVILVGDLMQLAPVKGKYIFDEPNNPKFRPFHNVNSLWHSFKPMILSHNHRQGTKYILKANIVFTIIIFYS